MEGYFKSPVLPEGTTVADILKMQGVKTGWLERVDDKKTFTVQSNRLPSGVYLFRTPRRVPFGKAMALDPPKTNYCPPLNVLYNRFNVVRIIEYGC